MALFAFFGIWEVALAAGIGVSVPVVIHLLNRRRYRVVTWAAMRFLLAAQRQNTRRMRIEQILLLLVRAALVLFIVLAMASVMPWAERLWAMFLPGGGPLKGPGVRVHHLIVLDGSLSMNVGGEDGTVFDLARQQALKKIKDAASGDGFSVLLMKENPTWIVGETSYDARKVAREVEEASATHGNASLPVTLNMIAAKLAENANRFPAQAVYFFTDMQKATWASVPRAETTAEDRPGKDNNVLNEIGKRAKLFFVDAGRDGVGNLAVTDLAIEDPFITTGMEVTILFAVQNFDQKERKNLRIELLVGRGKDKAEDGTLNLRVVDQKLETLQAGERLNRSFTHRFTQPGTYAIRVQIEHDALPVDDVRTIIVTVKETIPLLLVNGKLSADRFDQATEYLRIALNPFPKGQEPKYAPLRPSVVSAAQFDAMPENDLLGYDGLYFCDVGEISPAALRRLNTFLRLGGGVVFSVGDQVADNLEVYNRLLYSNGQGLLPAKLTQRAQDQFTLQAAEEEFKEPPLKVFIDDDDRIALRSSRFRQYLVAQPPSEAKVRTILTYMREEKPAEKGEQGLLARTNHPTLLEWNPPLPRLEQADGKPVKGPIVPLRYRGKVILLTSTLNMDWNSWPGSPSYGAMMQELARLAVSGKLRGHAQVVGSILEEFFPSGGLDLDVQMVPPNPLAASDANAPALKARKIKTQSQGEVSIFRWTETDIAGIYTLTAPNDPREHLFAVNVPVGTADARDSESDLARLDHEHLKDLYPGWDFQVVSDPSQIQMTFTPPTTPPTDGAEEDAPPELGDAGSRIAQWLTFAVLCLLILEVVLAWRFGHYSVVEGATAPAATGKMLPITIAIIAGLLFVAFAWTLIEANQSGEFLGFLPDWLRSWFERFLGVPPAPPGEGTRWELDSRPFFRDSASDFWPFIGIALASLFLIFHIYREEGPLVRRVYKVLLGGLRLGLILFTLFILLPQLKLRFDRQGWPDVVLIVDDSRSMGESDSFVDEQVRERAQKLGDEIRNTIKDKLPAKIEPLEAELRRKEARVEKNKVEKNDDPFLDLEVEQLKNRLRTWQSQLNDLGSPSWSPTRLQLVQALLAQPKRDWLNHLVNDRHTKVHIYHLDKQGRAVKLTSTADGSIGEITEADPRQLELAHLGVANLEAEGMDSRLGSAVRHVIDHYRGAVLSAVIMFTDGITTRDETLLQVSEYAAQKGVPLYFVGIGDDHEVRELKLHDLQVDDVVYVNDTVNFEARLTGHGYKDLTVPVILKVKDKNGKETELSRVKIKVDEQGKSVRVKLQHQPTEVGRKHYIIEVDVSKKDSEKPISSGNLRLERAIDVMDSKPIKVLLVDGTARYEYRFLKALLEREVQDKKKDRSIDLRVVLLDADADFPAQDKSALSDFPATREELNAYDVVILGDVDPNHAMLKEQRLRNLADFVRGEDAKGRKSNKTGGGLLFIAGTRHNPHSFKGTPLADVMPVEPIGKKQVDTDDYTDRYFLDLTPVGRQHNIFRFSNDEVENVDIWRRKLDKMYWWSTGYRIKPLAEVLAVHPTKKAAFAEPGQDPRQPLVVQQFVGSGRTMFFGFDESWRWRFREYEIRYNKFWIQTIRYLSRNRLTRTDLRLDRQTPYRVGEQIKVTVRFPDNTPIPGKDDPKQLAGPFQVKVIVEYFPKKDATAEVRDMTLAKQEGMTIFEGTTGAVREGKYRFRLGSPDVSKLQPDGEKPNAEATVELPPGELDKLRLNRRELAQAADATMGGFYTLANADKLLEDLPTGNRVSLSTPRPPVVLWTNPIVFLIVLGLLTGEWILRKRKHLL